MLTDTGIDDVKKQRNAEYAKHINDPVLSSLKMEGICLLFFFDVSVFECCQMPLFAIYKFWIYTPTVSTYILFAQLKVIPLIYRLKPFQNLETYRLHEWMTSNSCYSGGNWCASQLKCCAYWKYHLKQLVSCNLKPQVCETIAPSLN
jgi:hypothetical protein